MSECKNLKECIDEIRKMANEFDMKVKVDEQGWQVEQERDALQAQVAVLRGALETATDYLYNPFEPDNQCAQYKNIKNILQTTPSEAAERVQKLVAALEDCRNLISKTEFPTVAEQADNALSEWRRDKCS